MANQILARLGVVMTLNVAKWEQEVNQAIEAEKKLKREITKQNNDAAKEILKLTYAVQDFGREVTLVEKIQREFVQGGKYAHLAEEGKAAFLKQAAAMDALVASSKKAQKESIKAAGLTTYQLQALSYQTTDIVTSLAGGQNPMLVLLQQGGQLRDQFGGVTNVFKAFAQVLTLTRVVVGGLAAAFGTLAYAAYKGNEEFKEFNNSLILSGNTAGLTFDKFRGLAQSLAGGGMVGLKDAKDIFASLASSGQFTSKSIESVAQSIALVSRLSGQSVDVVGKELISAFNGTASSAKNLNEKYNFLTLAQYRQIEAMEKVGDKQGAINTLSQALNEKLEKQAPQLGTIAKLWNSLANTWERIKNIGVPDTDEQMLEFLSKQVNYYQTMVDRFPEAEARQRQLSRATEEYLKLSNKVREDRKKAEEEAKKAQDEKTKIDLYAKAGGLATDIRKKYELEKTLDDIQFQSRLENAKGLERIDIEAEHKAAEARRKIRQKNEEENNVFVIRNKKQLDADLDAIEKEKLQKRNAMEFEARKSIEEKVNTVLNEVEANKELIALFEKQKVVTLDDIEKIKVRKQLQDEINKIIADPRISQTEKDRLQNIMKEAFAQKELTEGRKKLLEKAIETEKAVRDAQKTESDSVALEKRKLEIYSENLLMTEAEKDIALSRLETEQKIAAIRQKMIDNPEFSARGEGLIAEQGAIQRRREEVIGLAERLKVLRDVNQAVFSNMENAIVNFVKTGKLSFKDLARSIIQDILAIYMKAQMLQMFKSFGGLFGGGGVNSGGLDVSGGMGEAVMSFALTPRASGGYVDGPSLVGENGPELFIPRTAGTIVPNQQMAGMTGTPQVVYNGPYIANMQAIDTQSAAQFLARNKESVWAANQSASRSVPQSR